MTPRRLAPILLLGALLLTGWAYLPGLSGGFQFDDQPSLAGLSEVTDARSAAEYALSGQAGPLGRPIAMASFLIHRNAWPDRPDEFLRGNLLIHLLNGLLVAWLAFRLARARGSDTDSAAGTATLCASLWSAMPILASTSLLIVQRMTSLSATFALAGLVAYLIFRRGLDRRPGPAMTGMSISLVIFTILAALTKENGILVPVMALVAEMTLLQPPQRLTRITWRVWQGVFLVFPLAFILAVLAAMLPYSTLTEAVRGVSAGERLLTQSVFLWEYLFHAFLPIETGNLGPLQDSRVPFTSVFHPAVLAAIVGWALVTAAAIRWRQRLPTFSFAVFWYLGGHLVESTLVPLELYFEHRNYLPLLGPVFAVSWAVFHAPRRIHRFVMTSAVAYFSIMVLTLSLVTTTWGQPFEATRDRYLENPGSSRAAGQLFAQLYGMGAIRPATRVLDVAIKDGIDSARFRVVKLYLACLHGTRIGSQPDVGQITRAMTSRPFDRNLAQAVFLLARARVNHSCEAIGRAGIEELLATLSTHPIYGRHDASMYWVHRGKAVMAFEAGEHRAAERDMKQALTRRFDPNLLKELALGHARSGRLAQACDLLDDMEKRGSSNPVSRLHRLLVTERLRNQLLEMEGPKRDPRLAPDESSPCRG